MNGTVCSKIEPDISALPRCKNPQLTSLPISHNTINTNVAYRVAYWVIGSMDRWFDGSKVCWFDGCVESSIDRWFDGSLVRWIVGSMDRRFVG